MYTQQKVHLPDGHELNHLVEKVQQVNVYYLDKSIHKIIMMTRLTRSMIHYHCLNMIDEIMLLLSHRSDH